MLSLIHIYKIKEINQYLECRSYEEFQEKFAPCIYSFFDANTQSVQMCIRDSSRSTFRSMGMCASNHSWLRES